MMLRAGCCDGAVSQVLSGPVSRERPTCWRGGREHPTERETEEVDLKPLLASAQGGYEGRFTPGRRTGWFVVRLPGGPDSNGACGVCRIRLPCASQTQTPQRNPQTSLPPPLMTTGDQLGNLGPWIQGPKTGSCAACIPDSVAPRGQDLLFGGGGGFLTHQEKAAVHKSWFGKPKRGKKAMEKKSSFAESPRVMITCPLLEPCFDFKRLTACNNTHQEKVHRKN